MKSLMIFVLLLLALPLFGLPQTYDMPIVLILIVAIGVSVYRLLVIHGRQKEYPSVVNIPKQEQPGAIKKDPANQTQKPETQTENVFIKEEEEKNVGKVRESARKIRKISRKTSSKIQELLSDDDKKEISDAIQDSK